MLRFAAILRDWEGTWSEAADDILYGENESRELKGNELCKRITLTLLTPQFKAYSNGLLTSWKLLARRKSESQVVQMGYIIVIHCCKVYGWHWCISTKPRRPVPSCVGVAGFELGYIDSLHLHPSMLFEFWYCEDLWRYQDWTPPPFPRYWDNVEPGCDRFSLLAAAMATPFCICCIHTSQNPPLRVRWFFLYSKKWGIKTIIFRMFNCHVGLLEGFMYIPFSEICAPFRFQSLQGQISEENARPHCAERGKENVRFEVAGG